MKALQQLSGKVLILPDFLNLQPEPTLPTERTAIQRSFRLQIRQQQITDFSAKICQLYSSPSHQPDHKPQHAFGRLKRCSNPARNDQEPEPNDGGKEVEGQSYRPFWSSTSFPFCPKAEKLLIHIYIYIYLSYHAAYSPLTYSRIKSFRSL